MRAIILSFFILLLMVPLCAYPNLQTHDARSDHAVILALLAADWYSTQEVIRRGGYEMNPIVGRHPSEGRLNTHFVTSVALYFFVHDRLDAKHAALLRRVLIMTEFACVANNVTLLRREW